MRRTLRHAAVVSLVGLWLLLPAGAARAAEPPEVADALADGRLYVEPGAEPVADSDLPAAFGQPPASVGLVVLATPPAGGTRGFADAVLAEAGGTVLVFTPEEVEVASAVASDRQVEQAFDDADRRADIADTVAYAVAFEEALREGSDGAPAPLRDWRRWLVPLAIGLVILLVVASLAGRLLRPRRRRRGVGRMGYGGGHPRGGFGRGYRRSRLGGLGMAAGWAAGRAAGARTGRSRSGGASRPRGGGASRPRGGASRRGGGGRRR